MICAPATQRCVLADTSGTVEVDCMGVPPPSPGDWVTIRIDPSTATEGTPRAEAIEILTRYAKPEPFLSPGGEHYRLHSGARPRVERLRLRAKCLAAIRAYFDSRGYLEIQSPLRVPCPGLEPHLRAVPTGDQYLITSPEYHLKRLLAAGLERIYSLGPCWRGEEIGRHHLGEFCMLEWYCAFSTLEELMVETEELLAHLARELLGGSRIQYQGRELDLTPPFPRLTVAEAFARDAGIDLAGVTEAAELERRMLAAGLGPLPSGAQFDALASQVLVERVEPALVGTRPVFLYDFPAPLAALSRLRPSDPSVAERFELYAGGLELGNAFGELADPEEQEQRLKGDQEARRQAGAPVYPIDQRFLDALREGIPPSAGIAVGVDRLLMLLADTADIRDVVAFAPDEV